MDFFADLTLTHRGGTPALVVNAKGVEERKGARAMKTPKERLEMHIQIVQSNARKLREWKQKGGKRS